MTDHNNPSQQQGTKPGQQNPMPGKPGQSSQQTGTKPSQQQPGQSGSDKK